MILHYSLPILNNNDNALSLLLFSNAQGLDQNVVTDRIPKLRYLSSKYLLTRREKKPENNNVRKSSIHF